MSVRLIGITGLGGYGKSTLAARLLADNEQQSNFSRVLWLKLAQFYNFSVWGRGLLKLLGETIDEQANDEDLIHVVIHNLSQQRYLLVLDNLESLLQEGRQWQDVAYQQFLLQWLEYGQGSIVLITSRERPDIPLNMLPRSRWLDGLGGLSLEEGEALLRGLGIQGESSDIQAVVQRVDGHPLLLELIAGTLIDEDDHPHIRGLEQDLMQLVGLHQGDQETSVEKILTWSLRRLEIKFQKLLLGLSVFRLPFDISTATAMLSEGKVTEKELRDLAKRSLLQAKKEQGLWKFRFQPLVQKYLQNQAGTKIVLAHNRAINYYQNVSKNVLLSLDDFVPYQEIFYHYCQLGEYTKASSVMEDCDSFFESQGHNNLRVKLYEDLLKNWNATDEEQSQFSAFLAYLGKAYDRLGKISDAFIFFQRSQQISQQINDLKRVAEATYHIATFQGYMRKFNPAIENQSVALKIAKEINDRNLEVRCWMGLGDLRYHLYSYQASITCYEKALRVSRSLCDRQEEAQSLMGLGKCYLAQGYRVAAIECFEDSLSICHEINSRTGENIALSYLGNAYFSAGQYESAIKNFNLAREKARQFENHLGEATILISLCMCYGRLERHEEALEVGLRSVEIMSATRNLRGEAEALAHVAVTYQSLEEYHKSIDFFKKGLKIAEEIDDYDYVAIAWTEIGDILKILDLHEEADSYYKKAIELLTKIYRFKYHGRIQISHKRRLDNLASRIKRKLKHSRKYSKENYIDEYLYLISPFKIREYNSWEQSKIGLTTEYYKSWIKLLRDVGCRKSEALCIFYLGNILFCTNQYEQALLHYENSLAIQNDIKDTKGIFDSLNSISLVYATLKQHEHLLNSYRKSLMYAQRIKDDWQEAVYHFNIGVALEKLNYYSDAVESYKNAYTIFQSTGEDEDWEQLVRDVIKDLESHLK